MLQEVPLALVLLAAALARAASVQHSGRLRAAMDHLAREEVQAVVCQADCCRPHLLRVDQQILLEVKPGKAVPCLVHLVLFQDQYSARRLKAAIDHLAPEELEAVAWEEYHCRPHLLAVGLQILLAGNPGGAVPFLVLPAVC